MNPAGGFDFMAFLPLVVIFVIFYFLLIRPQQRKMKSHQALLGAIRRGDRVVTSGGIIGTVTKIISDQELRLEIAEGVEVRIVRSMISDVLSKSGVATDETPESSDNESPVKRVAANKPRKTTKGK